ncbi:MAG: SUMF1/EgtB/PvdO family nonheme iron enzyme [bacterium]|nr:SUMF1/EgtB/PvdO family nonheme iron enzyme [bacterium]
MSDGQPRVACPACQTRFKADVASVPEGAEGLTARCRRCAAPFRVTRVGDVLQVAAVSPPAPDKPPAGKKAEAPAAPSKSARKKSAPAGKGSKKARRSATTSTGTTASRPLPAGAFHSGERVGRYEIESVVGRGGMGTIYQAYDPATNRHVALKVLLKHASDLDRLRFQREVEIQGNVQHPNIMPILDSGMVGSQRYYVMELLKDPLDLIQIVERVRRGEIQRDPHLRPLARIEGLIERIILPVCQAIHYANGTEGVLHRDIKPSNIMLDRASLRPLLIDFGVSAILDKQNVRLAHLDEELPIPLKGAGVRVTGTLVFMPPEQARGEADRRGDVWAIGAVLHYLVAGEPPLEQAVRPLVEPKERIEGLELLIDMAEREGRHDEAREFRVKRDEIVGGGERTVENLQQDVLQGNYLPRPPGLSRSLDAIIDRAMSKQPADRYRHALELHDDLRAWLQARPVQAHVRREGAAGGTWYRTRLFLRRHWLAVALLLVGIGAGALLAWPSGDDDAARAARVHEATKAARAHFRAREWSQAELAARGLLRLDPGNEDAFPLLNAIRRGEALEAGLLRARELEGGLQRAWASEDPAAARLAQGALREALARVQPSLVSEANAEQRELFQTLDLLARDLHLLDVSIPGDAKAALLPVAPGDGAIQWDAPKPIESHLTSGAWVLQIKRENGTLFVPFAVRSGSGPVRIALPFDPGGLDVETLFVPGGIVRGPLGEASVSDLLWDRTEVTADRYARFLQSLPPAERRRRVPREATLLGEPGRPLWELRGANYMPPRGARTKPVEGISLRDAQAFARFEGKRLPTASEWAHAASGPDGRPCALGAAGRLTQGLAHLAQSGGRAKDVRMYAADRSPFGLYDMAGNLAEYTSTLDRFRREDGWFVMGGAYNTPAGAALISETRVVPGWLPVEGVGFRCVKAAK